jgi:hypothetical protein
MGGSPAATADDKDESQIDPDFYYGDAPEGAAAAAAAAVAASSVASTVGAAERIAEGHVLLMECLALLLANNSENSQRFRAGGGTRVLFSMVSIAESRVHSLRVVQQLVLDPSRHAHDDLSTLLELLQAAPPSHFALKIDILKTCLNLFSLDARTKLRFREVQGFVCVMPFLRRFYVVFMPFLCTHSPLPGCDVVSLHAPCGNP